MLANYQYFRGVAESVQWDETTLDLAEDARAWPGLDPADRDSVLGLLAGFAVADTSVADQLEPFATAASDADAAECFRAQAVDVARHARFFDRVAAEVAGVPGSSPPERLVKLRALLPQSFLELFEVRLPTMARDLGAGVEDLRTAVGLYHMILEGVVLSEGQLAFLDLLNRVGTLPGLRTGVELVHRDMRWHIGFGARCLQDVAVDPRAVARIVAEGNAAARAWGEAIGDEYVMRMTTLLSRRLRAIGLMPKESRRG
jgi:ribonucleoside-diphosphate reductase beta chain